ncbi:tetratricopeptide repeat protein [Cerasicoccus fimbriatus]|uniref:tetratricopeptide repeat protein n=1 Tax=Cerasicoccus fimbriatus TaxID=3014554 RepID=UPI0022B2FE78|nr:tetratricopeptide repeat protein [Cerasicoccus sp. TK19100]
MAGLIRRFTHRLGGVATALLLLATSAMRAQEQPENANAAQPVASLMDAAPVKMISDWPEWRIKMLAGDDALQLGLPGLAEGFYRSVLDGNPDLNAEAKALLQVKIASALIAQRRFSEAKDILPPEEGPVAPAVVLRRAILAYHDGRLAETANLLQRLQPSSLSLADQPWYYLLRGMELRARDDQPGSTASLEEALVRSVSPAQTAQIEAVILKGAVMAEQDDLETLKVLQRKVEETRGARAGFDFARQMAVVLDRLNRKDEAIAVLRDQMSMLTDREKAEAGQMLLLIGLISGRDSARGQLAFREILGGKGEADTQRLALYLLAASASQPGETRDAFRRTLDELIAQSGNPLLDELLMMRARLNLESGDAVGAEADVRQLIENYPGSPLLDDALWLRAYIAWQDGRYRGAAESLGQIRDRMEPGPTRVRIGEQIGDVLFLKGDYAAAADMYSGVLSEDRDSLFDNMLFYQAVLANTLAERWENAQALLDNQTDYPLDVRWRAEWIYLDGLRKDGQAAKARDRLADLVRRLPVPTDQDLRWRIQWLQARLAYDTGASAQAAQQAQALAQEVERAVAQEEGWPVIGPEIASHLRLLEGQALIRSGQPDEGLESLAKLRENYPGSDPAILSILEEARYFAGKFSDAEAQRRLRELADRYRDSPHAPAALYEAAILADRQGLESTRREAIAILNDLITRYPSHPLVFRARLLQGNIARQLGDFGDARLVYETVLRDYANHPEIYLAQLYRANTLLARSGNDPALLDEAQTGLERLDKESVPIDVRVEAGYMLSRIQLQLNNPQRAAETLWLVVSRYLRDPSAANQLGANGKYWMARCLIELGDIQERAGNVEDAREVYSLIGKYALPGQNLAAARREKLRQLAAAAPAQN